MKEKSGEQQLPIHAVPACKTCACSDCVSQDKRLDLEKQQEGTERRKYQLLCILAACLIFWHIFISGEVYTVRDTVVGLDTIAFYPFNDIIAEYYMSKAVNDDLCPQADRLFPDSNSELWKNVSVEVASDPYRAQAIKWLGGAVRVPCVLLS